MRLLSLPYQRYYDPLRGKQKIKTGQEYERHEIGRSEEKRIGKEGRKKSRSPILEN